MGAFNIDNFLIIRGLERNGIALATTIYIEEEPVARTCDNVIKPIGQLNIYEALNKIYFSHYPPIIKNNTYTPQLSRTFKGNDDSATLSSVLADYVSRVDAELIPSIPANNIIITYNTKLDSKKYIQYVKNTDPLLSSMMYQWLEHRFVNMSGEPISVRDLTDRFMQRLPETNPNDVLKLLLKLNILGFLQITVNYAPKTNTTAAMAKEDGKAATETLPDRFSLASFVGRNLEAKNYSITIISQNNYFDLHLLSMKDDNAEIKHFFTTLLETFIKPVGVIGTNLVHPDIDHARMRLLVFSRAKQLPLKLFGNWGAEESRNSSFELFDKDYIRKLYIYRMAGIDIVDMTILSLLKIKTIPLNEIISKVGNYTSAEVYRSLFSLILLGIVCAVPQQADIPNILVIGGKSPATASNRSLLSKLMDKIKAI